MPQQLAATDLYLTHEDLAKRLKVGLGTVREWRAKGTGPRVTKFGQLVRYHISDVEDWERSRREVSA
jgi:excisionase family DNA binding protein